MAIPLLLVTLASAQNLKIDKTLTLHDPQVLLEWEEYSQSPTKQKTFVQDWNTPVSLQEVNPSSNLLIKVYDWSASEGTNIGEGSISPKNLEMGVNTYTKVNLSPQGQLYLYLLPNTVPNPSQGTRPQTPTPEAVTKTTESISTSNTPHLLHFSVTLHHADYLLDYGGHSNPHCTFQIIRDGVAVGQQVSATTQNNTSLSPVWNETFHFTDVDKSKDVLQVYLWNTTLMGEIRIPLKDINSGEKWFPLQNGKTGMVQLEFVWSDTGAHLIQNSETVQDKGFTNWYCVTLNKVQNLDKSLMTVYESLSKKKKSGTLNLAPSCMFSTYQIQLHMIPEIWGEVLQVKDFASSPNPNMDRVRELIRKQHDALYSESKDVSTKGTLSTGEQLFTLLGYGCGDCRKRMYTYVLLEDRMRFAETSPLIKDSLITKHLVHSCASSEVRYAGEFQIRFDDITQKPCLVVDNKSGTYAPKKEYLPLLQRTLEYNFPDIQIETLDRYDPLLTEYTNHFWDS